MSNAYPKDDFDDIPDSGPVGVHRKPSSPWLPVMPFLVVLVVVPLLAWGVASLIQRNVPEERLEEIVPVAVQSEAQSEGEEVVVEEEVVVPPVPPSDLPTAAPDTLDGDGPAQNETPATDPDIPVDHDASVGVYNASGVQGLAGQKVDTLTNGGFWNSFAENTNDWGVGQNTVFYPSANYRSTAQAVADLLGIGSVVEDVSVTGDASIFVLLVN